MKTADLLASLWFTAASVIGSTGLGLPVYASSVRVVTPEEAASGEVVITVENGAGTNIDFSDTGELIRRAWLDDQSKLTVDYDGNLELGARIIHLRRISGLQFDNLPSTPSTMLTVITTEGDETNLYHFPIYYGNTEDHVVAVRPAVIDQREEGTLEGEITISVEAVRAGLSQVIADGTISSESKLVEQVNQFIDDVTAGKPSRLAANDASLPWELISNLSRRGSHSLLLEGLEI